MMLGLRTQESDKFEEYFLIVQAEAKKTGCVFFFDTGDGREFETNTLEGEDLMGWLIPDDKVPKFINEYEQWSVSDDWLDFYKWAIWDNSNDKISISFKGDCMSEEAYKFIIKRVIQNALDATEEAKENNDDFYNGRKLAYYEMLDTIKSELYVRDADLKEFGLDINLEKEFI